MEIGDMTLAKGASARLATPSVLAVASHASAVTNALIRPEIRRDDNDDANRLEAVAMLSTPRYAGPAPAVIVVSMSGAIAYGTGDVREAPDFNLFFRHSATCLFYSDAVRRRTRMRRGGRSGAPKPDAWSAEVAAKVCRPDIRLPAPAPRADTPEARGQRP